MSDKDSPDAYASHDEKMAEPEMADPAGRRKSVALNVVENPLRVSFATSALSPHLYLDQYIDL